MISEQIQTHFVFGSNIMRILSVFLLVIAAALLPSCSKPQYTAEERALICDIVPGPLPKVSFQTSSREYNKFAIETYLKTTEDNDTENLVFSPYSFSMTLEILRCCSNGETAKEIDRLLHLPDDAKQVPEHPMLFEYVPPPRQTEPSFAYPPIFLTANSIWYSDKLTLNKNTAKQLKRDYFLDAFPVDFQADTKNVAERMNLWCKNATQGIVPQFQSAVSDKTMLCFLGTLYFKAHWKHKFEAHKTKDQKFTLISGKTIQVPTMWEDIFSFRFAENDEVKCLEMLYVDDIKKPAVDKNGLGIIENAGKNYGEFSMLFLLPKRKDGILELEQKIDPEMIEKLCESMKETALDVSIPKFRIKNEVKLRSVMEISSLTSPDLSGLFSGNAISLNDIDATQNIVLGIDEHGTESGVITEFAYAALSDEKPKFIADHPFLFLVRERKTGTILFIGRVMDPSVQ